MVVPFGAGAVGSGGGSVRFDGAGGEHAEAALGDQVGDDVDGEVGWAQPAVTLALEVGEAPDGERGRQLDDLVALGRRAAVEVLADQVEDAAQAAVVRRSRRRAADRGWTRAAARRGSGRTTIPRPRSLTVDASGSTRARTRTRRSGSGRSARIARRRSSSGPIRRSKIARIRPARSPKWYWAAELLRAPASAPIWRSDTPWTPRAAISRSAASRRSSRPDGPDGPGGCPIEHAP